MAGSTQSSYGLLTAIWRYPVKSMMGEELNAAEAAADGLLGDRAYALVDSSDGKVATAKNPRKWPTLFDFRATLADSPSTGRATPPVRITLPDGTIISSEQPEIHEILSTVLNRPVTLDATLSQELSKDAEKAGISSYSRYSGRDLPSLCRLGSEDPKGAAGKEG